MAEIRANCKYRLKGFHFSGEFAKHPPTNSKRWTFRNPRPAGDRFNNRPDQRVWDECSGGKINWPGGTNAAQSCGKTFDTPESQLRAEFFNAYKKYYRRVDIKRLEVESTLNVDAKYKTADTSVEGESSLYKEKECMEINIVLDTEEDDAMVSGKVKRTVVHDNIGAPYGDVTQRRSNEIVGLIGLDRNENAIGNGDHKASKLVYGSDGNVFKQPNQPARVNFFPCDTQEYANSLKGSENFDNRYRNKGSQPTVKQTQEHFPLRSFAVSTETPRVNESIGNEGVGKKSFQEFTRMAPGDRQETSLRNNYTIDPMGNLSDSTGRLETHEKKYAVIWGPSLASLEDENGELSVNYERHPKLDFNSRNRKYISLDGNSTCDAGIQSNSDSCFRFYDPDESDPPEADESFRIQNYQQQNNTFKNLEFSVRDGCEGENPCTGTYAGIENISNNQEVLHLPQDCRFFRSRFGLPHGPEKTRVTEMTRDKCNHSGNSAVLRHENFRNDPSDRINDVFGSDDRSSRVLVVGELENHRALRSEPQFRSGSPLCIRYRGLRGSPFKESNKYPLKSLVRTVTQSYSDNVEGEEMSRNYQDNVENDHFDGKGQPCFNSGEGKLYININNDSHAVSQKFIGSKATFRLKDNQSQNTLPENSHHDSYGAEKCGLIRKPADITSISQADGRYIHVEEPFVNRRNESEIKSIIISKKNCGISDKNTKLKSNHNACSIAQRSSEGHCLNEMPENYRNHSNGRTPITCNNAECSNVFRIPYSEEDCMSECYKSHGHGERTVIKNGKNPENISCYGEPQSYKNTEKSLELRGDKSECRIVSSRGYGCSNAPESECYRDQLPDDSHSSREGKGCSQERCNRILNLKQISGRRSNKKHCCKDSEKQWQTEELGDEYGNSFRESPNKREVLFEIHNQLNDCQTEKIEFIKQTSKNHPNLYAVYEENGDQSVINTTEQDLDLCKTNCINCPKVSFSNSNQNFKDFSTSHSPDRKFASTESLRIGPTYSLDYSPGGADISQVEHSNKQNNFGNVEGTKKFSCGHPDSNSETKSRAESVKDCRCFGEGPRKERCKECSTHLDYCVKCYNDDEAQFNVNNDRSGFNLCGFHKNSINHNRDCEELQWKHQTRGDNTYGDNRCLRIGYGRDMGHQCKLKRSVYQHRGRFVPNCPEEGERFHRGHSFNGCQDPSDKTTEANNNRCFCRNNENHCAIVSEKFAEPVHFKNDMKDCCGHSGNEDHSTSVVPIVDHERHRGAGSHQPKRNLHDNRMSINDRLVNGTHFVITGRKTDNLNDKIFSVMKKCKKDCTADNKSYYRAEFSCDHQRATANEGNRKIHSVEHGDNKSSCLKKNLPSSAKEDRKYDDASKNNGKKITFSVSCNTDEPNYRYERPIDEMSEIFPKEKKGSVSARSVTIPNCHRRGKEWRSVDIQTMDNEIFPRSEEVRFVSDSEPRYISEEQWESDQEQPTRRDFCSSDEEDGGEDNKKLRPVSSDDPSYLKAEQWETDDEEAVEYTVTTRKQNRKVCSLSSHEVNDPSFHCEDQKSFDGRRSRRDISNEEENRQSSPDHGVKDPGYHCAEQWESDEDTCENFKKTSTLPKNRGWRRKRNRRAFNPKRWDMVTDLPKNEYAGRQYRQEGEDTSSYECSSFGSTLVFKNRRYDP